MRHSSPLPLTLATACTILLSGCTQSLMNQSAIGLLGQVIQAGIAVGTSSSTTTTTASSGGADRAAPPAAATAAIGTAERFLGVPYKWGGNTPSEGFDCSGFTKYVYAKNGVALPRVSREQANAGQGVALRESSMRAGDLMLFAEPGEAISHVAIYAGDGWFIHASSAGRGVVYTQLDEQRNPWYSQNLVVVRRVTSNGRSLVQSLSLISRPGLKELADRAPAPR